MNKSPINKKNKERNTKITCGSASASSSISFWDCKTKEDEIARNLWLCFMVGLLAFSCLILGLNKIDRFSDILMFA